MKVNQIYNGFTSARLPEKITHDTLSAKLKASKRVTKYTQTVGCKLAQSHFNAAAVKASDRNQPLS